MAIYSSESLEVLRRRIDLVELLSGHLSLKKSGAAYHALCPFHDEKTPSFVVKQGDRHYHCYGCGAHGDAIEFLMSHLKLSFQDAIESLAERFGVQLVKMEAEEQKGPPKKKLKDALEMACHLYHFLLLNSAEGKEALAYLQERGLGLEFIRRFRIGLAPRAGTVLYRLLREKEFSEEILAAAGLIKPGQRDFFSDRITFPIHQATGEVIGFSARKYREQTGGGKYVNSPETALFKKSKVLFGLNYSRRTIAKERKALIVEGQIDALRLIDAGFDYVVAGQGTAFGEDHVKELIQLGVQMVYLALDADQAGRQAAQKIGDLFQRAGIGVKILNLPEKYDPDLLVREKGAAAFTELISKSSSYLHFLVNHRAQEVDLFTPAGKSTLAGELSRQIYQWSPALMVHESLRQLAHLLQVPEEMVGVGQSVLPNRHIRKTSSIGTAQVKLERTVEHDFLRWLLFGGAHQAALVKVAAEFLEPAGLENPLCRELYQTFMCHYAASQNCDLLTLVQTPELQTLIIELSQKKVEGAKVRDFFFDTLQHILTRNWMEKREDLRKRIHSCEDEAETALLLQQFGELTKHPPQMTC